ncbi:MAG: DNA-processing protein DprA [Actinobacteria bacterium]|nr:DNA-processing protein DprA [Actinomycetota bacterium]
MNGEEAALGLSWVTAAVARPALRLLEEYGVEAVWRATPAALRRMHPSPDWVESFVARRSLFVPDQMRAALRAGGLRFIPYGHADYPAGFRHLPTPPAGVYLRGEPEVYRAFLGMPRITVVGTRAPTPYGLAACAVFTREFATAGVAVVSGLALGIDAQAHRAALEVGAVTAAVLGCGVDVPYPRRHRGLYGRIRREGVLLSELPPGWPPAPWTFPERNRLLAALGDAVLVVEAGARSGALGTAGWAADLGRHVQAIPGPVFGQTFIGSHRLIAEGAACCFDPGRAVEEFFRETRTERGERGEGPPHREPQAGPELGSATRLVVLALAGGARTVDEVAAAAGLSAAEAAAALALLELQGAAARAGPGRYMLVSLQL